MDGCSAIVHQLLSSKAAGYLFALGVTAGVVAVRAALAQALDGAATFLPFVLAVTVAAAYRGLGPGLAATLLGAVAGAYFFTPPTYVFWVEQASDQVRLLIFLVSGVVISWLCESLHAARRASDAERRQREQEIRERRKAQAVLQENQVLLQAIIDNSAAAIAVKDREGRYLLVNLRIRQWLGKTQDQILGATDRELFPQDVADRFRANDRQVIETGEMVQREETVPLGDELHTFLSVKFPLRDTEGNVSGVCIIATDISSLKQTERNLRESQQRLQQLMAANVCGVVVGDLTGRVLEANDYYLHMFGYDQQDVAEGRLRWDWITPRESRAAEQADCEELSQTGTIAPKQKEYLHKQGSRVPVLYGAARLDDGGPDPRFIGFCVDLTHLQQALTRQRQQNERLQLLSEVAVHLLTHHDSAAMVSGLFEKIRGHFALDTYFNFLLDRDGRTLKLESYAGVPAEAAEEIRHLELGQFVCGAVAARRAPIVEAELSRSDDPKVTWLKRIGVRCYACFPLAVDQRLYGTISFGSCQRDAFDEDELEFFQTMARYLTVAYERLRLLSELREADRRKDEFLAMLAHELRNPLAPIRSGLDILAMEADGQQEMIDLMRQQTDHVVRLVDDLLDVSRIVRGRIELRKQPVELASALNRAVAALRPAVESRSQSLTIDLPPAPLWLDADPVRLAQVFENLLSNASKYTDVGGRIGLKAQRRGAEAVVAVWDNGIGIDPQLLPNVFDLFTQSTRTLDRAQGGLGIGLTLVRNLVEMHGGLVTAESRGKGQGSRFTVRLPLREAPLQQEQPQPIEKPSTTGRKILVVDDNQGVARMFSMLLGKMGPHEIDLAYDGPAALDKVRRDRPDIVFLDIGLPGMSGYDVAQMIRSDRGLDGVLLVALTGYGQDEDRRKSRQAGFDEHLVKPPSLEAIGQLLSHPKLATADEA